MSELNNDLSLEETEALVTDEVTDGQPEEATHISRTGSDRAGIFDFKHEGSSTYSHLLPVRQARG